MNTLRRFICRLLGLLIVIILIVAFVVAVGAAIPLILLIGLVYVVSLLGQWISPVSNYSRWK